MRSLREFIGILFVNFMMVSLGGAQTGPTKGKVTDENGKPFPGVNIPI